jgi:hypothetical protein
MSKRLFFGIAVALLMSSGAASAQNEPSQDTINAPTGLQSTTPDKPRVATVPEAATDAAGIPRQSAPAPVDQGNGNWDPPPVAKPTTQR